MVNRWITFDLDGTIMQNPFIDYVFPEIRNAICEENRNLTNCVESFVAEHRNRLNQRQYVEAYDWEEIITSYTQLHELNLLINVEEIVKKHCVPGAIYLLEEGILEVLQELKLRGYTLGVITNGYSKFQMPVMNALGLTPYFERIITPDMIGYAKPDEGVFMELGEVVAHIGDRIDHDIIPANTWGAKAIWINRSLPEQLKSIKLELRTRHEMLRDIILAKLSRESQVNLRAIPREAIPYSVIYKLEELLDIFL